MRPGTNVQGSTALPPLTPATETGTWFAIGPTATGPTTPYTCRSFAQFQKVFGPRISSINFAATFYDSIEAFFLRGGSEVVILRFQGATAKAASIALKDSASAETMEVKASGSGTTQNGWKVIVGGAEGAFTIQVVNAAGEVLESSPVFATKAEAVAYFKASPYVIVKEAGASTKSPAAGTFSLATGTDEAPTASKPNVEAQVALLPEELGPGQVSIPGITATEAIEGLYTAAAKAFATGVKRVAVADAPLLASKSTLATLGGVLKGLTAAVRQRGATYADWQQLPALQGAFGVRAVPCSPFVAACCAVNDSKEGHANQAPAGRWGILSPVSVGREAVNWTAKEVEELAEAGINVTRVALDGSIRIAGFRTSAPFTTEPLYYQFNNARIDMAVEWKASAVAEDYFGSDIDGQGKDAGDFKSDLAAMLLPLYDKGALFGETASDAFTVDTGSDINTPQTEEEGDLLAVIGLCRAKGAEMVGINITRVSMTQGV